MNRIATLVLLLAPWFSLSAQNVEPSAQQAASALQVREGYRIDLIASEPLITDPVSARLDRRGRLWVVEMPDYPSGPLDGNPPSGRIKILEDRDQDGTFDEATIFADQLVFATGVQPYRDGAIVTLSGRIVFMQDLDNDGTADQTTVWFKGFAEQNQQLRANHPMLGPDGLVYIANGLRGGKIEAVDPRFDQKPAPLDLRDRDFCFDPDGPWWGVVAGKSQFGLTIDDFGRRIGCSNRNPAMMTPLTLQAVDRDPWLASRDAIHNVALAAEQSRVFSRADAWTTSNLHSGQFSAACGVLAAGMEDDAGEWLLTCEPTAYLVQRQRMDRSESVWNSHREETEQEFLSSSNTWFRPVDATVGTGQSVIVVDMARAVIEHPDFMPIELKSRPDQMAGRNLGRIWKITPQKTEESEQRLDRLDQAFQWLNSKSPWQRQVASQMILESKDAVEVPLRSIMQSQDSVRGQARAAWILHRRGSLLPADTESLAKSPHARLRALAIDLSSELDNGIALAIRASSDSDPLVLRAAAASLAGNSDHPNHRIDGMAAIARATNDSWTVKILGTVDPALLQGLVAKLALADFHHPKLLNHLLQRISVDDPKAAATAIVRRLESQTLKTSKDVTTATNELLDCLESWIVGTKRGRRSPKQVLSMLDDTDRMVLITAFKVTGEVVIDTSFPPESRARAISIANETGYLPKQVEHLLDADTPPPVRVAILPILLRQDPQGTREYLIKKLMGMSVSLRSATVAACSRSADDTLWLLTKIEGGAIPKTVIDPATAKRFRQHANPEIRKLADSLLRSAPNRVAVLQRYAVSATQLGDAKLGKKLFINHCSACHRIDGQGTNVGPDISDTRTKTAGSLLTSILDPNAAIDASYIQYSVLTLDGRVLDGLLIDESSESVTLQQKGGERVTVPRQDIDRMQAPGISLMPEGFEQTMDPNAMSHLLAYLKNWRYLKTRIPGTLPTPQNNP